MEYVAEVGWFLQLFVHTVPAVDEGSKRVKMNDEDKKQKLFIGIMAIAEYLKGDVCDD